MDFLDDIKFDDNGLVSAIIQDVTSGEVRMLGYMNKESLIKTIETKKTWFFSRSRQKFWNKGESSGHFQHVKEMFYDCDGDAILIKVDQIGVTCHTGHDTCFYNKISL